MANISISLEGIDQAIANLNYRPNSVKQKAILAIRGYYTSEDSLSDINSIDTDQLIQAIWDVGENPGKIRSKRRNFSSIKSSINADLDKLSKKGRNAENITIIDSNIFDMTEEAKNNLLSSFTDAVKTGDIDLGQATNLLKAVTDFLDNFQQDVEDSESDDIVNQIKKILNKITEDVLSEEQIESTPGIKKLKRGPLDFEKIGRDDGEGQEDGKGPKKSGEAEGFDEGLEEIDEPDEDVEEIELDEDEELEEVDDLDDDLEEVELDEDENIEEIELGEDEEIEEIDEPDEDVEEIELDEDEELEEVDDLDDDLEEVELDEDENIEEIELGEDEEIEEIDEPDEDVEEIELDEDEELEEVDDLDDDLEEVELDEDENIEEIELGEDEEIEEINEPDEDVEEIELDEDEELEGVDDLDDDLEEVELDEDEDIEEIELGEDEEIEEIDEPDEDVEEIELDEDEELEELDIDEGEELKEVDGLTEDELKALEEYRKKKELAEQFDETLGEREKKYNKYTTVPEGLYTIGTKKSLKSSLELQQFDMPRVYIGIYPITNALFEIFIEETGYVSTAERVGYGRVCFSRLKKESNGSTLNKSAGSKDVPGACWHMPSGPGSSLHGKRNHPVVQVSVDDAAAFASWIGRRIPTEAEWESAARTDLGNKYPWGNIFDPNAMNIEQTGLADTCSVDEYDAFANEFQIIDLLGNVMEWTSDMQLPPISSAKPIKYCIAKGAGWNAKDDVSISSRGLFKPGFTSNIIGFRCISEIFL